jgi:hypothetical protein
MRDRFSINLLTRPVGGEAAPDEFVWFGAKVIFTTAARAT